MRSALLKIGRHSVGEQLMGSRVDGAVPKILLDVRVLKVLPEQQPGVDGFRRHSPPLFSPRVHLRRGRRRPRTMSCIAPPDSAEPKTDEQEVKADLVLDKDLNRRVAVLSTLAAAGLFASQRFKLGGFSLKDLAANVVPYEE